MLSSLIKYIPVYIGSMFKFIIGPTLGASIGLGVVETISLTVLGMMSSVIAFTFMGELVKKKLFKSYFESRKRFTKRNRQMVRFSRYLGISGISFLTPVLFSPILGTLLSISAGGKPSKIIIFMLLSSIFWAVLFTFGLTYLADY